MDREEIGRRTRSFYTRRLGNDAADVVSMFTPGGTLTIAGSTEASGITGSWTGASSLSVVLGTLVAHWRWISIDFIRMIIDGDTVAANYWLTAEFVPSGETIRTQVTDLLVMEGEHVSSMAEFIDTALVVRLAEIAAAR